MTLPQLHDFPRRRLLDEFVGLKTLIAPLCLHRLDLQSEHFRAHRDAGANKPLHLGHPEFEAFEAIQTIKNSNGREQAA